MREVIQEGTKEAEGPRACSLSIQAAARRLVAGAGIGEKVLIEHLGQILPKSYSFNHTKKYFNHPSPLFTRSDVSGYVFIGINPLMSSVPFLECHRHGNIIKIFLFKSLFHEFF